MKYYKNKNTVYKLHFVRGCGDKDKDVFYLFINTESKMLHQEFSMQMERIMKVKKKKKKSPVQNQKMIDCPGGGASVAAALVRVKKKYNK